jgi:small subunit ribosomal protein S20
MAHSVNAWKRNRQNIKARAKNKAVRSEISTFSKRVEEAVSGNDTALAKQYFLTAQKKLDKSGKTKIYHKNTVARKKSRIAKLMNKLAAGAPKA